MTQPAQPPVQGAQDVSPESTDPSQQQQPQDTGGNPYDNYLEKLPEGIRPLVEPVFKEWDAGVTQRFQELHSAQEPWKPVVEAYQPDDVMGALQVAQILEQDPERFLKAFADAYPELVQQALGQGNPTPEQPPATPSGEQGLSDLDPDDPVAKRIQQLEQQISQLTGNWSEKEQQEQLQEQQKYLDSMLEDLHKQHGEFDDTFILSQLAYRGATPDQAIQAWKETIGKYTALVTEPPAAPPVLPSNGGVPSTQFDASQIDDKDTKALVAQLLEQAAQQQHN